MSYKLKSKWLSSAKYPRKSPYAMTPQGIVVHNTAGDASATEEAAAMVGNSSAVSFHVVIDEEYAVECIPFSRNAFHAGDGAQGFAEICKSAHKWRTKKSAGHCCPARVVKRDRCGCRCAREPISARFHVLHRSGANLA